MTVCYYQTDTLIRNVIRIIKERKVKSLLDIGAGSPIGGCQLAGSVSEYLAVEEHLVRANALKQAGLDVMHARFPVPIDKQFDLVLSSHSIPELTEASLADYPPFVKAAWACVAPKGLLLIITFKGGAHELLILTSSVFADCDVPPRETGSQEFAALISAINEVSGKPPRVEGVCSHIVADNGEDMRKFISPWIAGTRRNLSMMHQTRLTNIIETRYLVRHELYVLPTEHLFIKAEK